MAARWLDGIHIVPGDRNRQPIVFAKIGVAGGDCGATVPEELAGVRLPAQVDGQVEVSAREYVGNPAIIGVIKSPAIPRR